MDTGNTIHAFANGKLAATTPGAESNKASFVFLNIVKENIVKNISPAIGRNFGNSFVWMGNSAIYSLDE